MQSSNAQESETLRRHVTQARDDAVSDVINSLNDVAKDVGTFSGTSERNAVTAAAAITASEEMLGNALNEKATALAEDMKKEHFSVVDQLQVVEGSLKESSQRMSNSEILTQELSQNEKYENEKGTILLNDVQQKIGGLENMSLEINETEMITEISEILKKEREKMALESNDNEMKILKNEIQDLRVASDRVVEVDAKSSALAVEQAKNDESVRGIQEKSTLSDNQSIENKIFIEEKEKEISEMKSSMYEFVNKIMDIEKTFGSELEKMNSDKSLKKLEKKLLDLQEFEIKLAFENKKIDIDMEEIEKLRNEILEDELNSSKEMEEKMFKLNEVTSKKSEKVTEDTQNLNFSFSKLEIQNLKDLKELKTLQSGGDNDLMDNLEKLQDNQHKLADSTKNFFVRSETEFRQKNLFVNEKAESLNNELSLIKTTFDDSLNKYNTQNKIASHHDVSSIENIKKKIDENILNLDNSIHAKVMKVTEDEIFTMNQNLISSSNKEKEKTRVSNFLLRKYFFLNRHHIFIPPYLTFIALLTVFYFTLFLRNLF